MGEWMRRKIKDSVIDTLEFVYFVFLSLSTVISFPTLIPFLFSFFTTRYTGPFTRIGPIWFLISFISYICFAVCHISVFEFLRKRNEKIDEEEKAQLQAKAQAEADKEKAELQIWVNE
jgi:type VI protein secretion system component VasK